MSVQFGRWNFEGPPPAPEYLEKVAETLAPYGPDSNESYSKGGIKILYRAFRTTRESHREVQPHVSRSGAMITWDGRLDNRVELISELRAPFTVDTTEVAIVAAAYEKWGDECLAKLIGDWALSIWNPQDCSLLLAKDFVGTRHLYYSFDDHHITWSTILDPLVLYAGKTFKICEEYVAGWMAMYPAAHLTPYSGIHAVPPCSSVILRPGKRGVNCVVARYWDFNAKKRICYRTDAEYEEHFRIAFSTAVRRNLRSDCPVVADLSGGMDSSSIVCMADLVIARGQAECPRLDTISWYDDSYDDIEPDTNELRWVVKVEEKRGKAGLHLNANKLATARESRTQDHFESTFDNHRFAAIPVPNRSQDGLFEQYNAYMKSSGHRASLCGIGGSEFLGDGTPSAKLELQNYMARLRLPTLVRQLNAWAAKMQKPRLPLLWEAARDFFPLAIQDKIDPENVLPPARWLHPGFVRRNCAALYGYPSRTELFGPLPSFQDNLRALDGDRMLLARSPLQPEFLREVRFPFLDRDLLEFVFAIPREQIVRVGQRRSLMKRALVGIVPDELLNRRRKTFVPPESRKDAAAAWPSLAELGERLITRDLGIIDLERFQEALEGGTQGAEEISSASLTHTLTIESWLRHLATHGVLTAPAPPKKQRFPSHLQAEGLHPPTQPKSLAS